MKETVKADYAEIYRTKEIRLLKGRIRRTKLALQVSSILIFITSILFNIIHPSFTIKQLGIYGAAAVSFLVLAGYSTKKPYKAVLLGIAVLILFGLADMMLETSDMMLVSNIIRLAILSILIFAFKTAKEADIIKKDIHLS